MFTERYKTLQRVEGEWCGVELRQKQRLRKQPFLHERLRKSRLLPCGAGLICACNAPLCSSDRRWLNVRLASHRLRRTTPILAPSHRPTIDSPTDSPLPRVLSQAAQSVRTTSNRWFCVSLASRRNFVGLRQEGRRLGDLTSYVPTKL